MPDSRGGMNVDPYITEVCTGRIRHVYASEARTSSGCRHHAHALSSELRAPFFSLRSAFHRCERRRDVL